MNKTEIAVNIFNKYANEYQQKFMNVELYHESLDLFCENIKLQNPSILELACGPGNITQYILNKRPDFKLLGTDLAPNMLELAQKNNPTASFKLMDCRDIKNMQEKFNGLMVGFCLPYLSKHEAITFIKHAFEILLPEGIIYISTMEDDHNKSGFKKGSSGEEMFMNYHEATYLTEALLNNHFSIIDLSRKVYTNADGSVTTDLIIIAKK